MVSEIVSRRDTIGEVKENREAEAQQVIFILFRGAEAHPPFVLRRLSGEVPAVTINNHR